ncbi:hypothetical protein GGR52DRAFT_265248 [Hypoxylon sp. FL1284]|nr:hypothetical protein GGR52DRAFT_265248 [Hypoxylon sp. FL1284]
MPTVNGVKMACEPCIRGHRSTKCSHGEERVLIQVRKPGRPLSSCPHAPGKACTCVSGVTTAALPKGRQCPCGTQSNKANGPPVLVKAEPPENQPVSPVKHTSYRIQKTKPARKLSVDSSALQRMNDSLNLMIATEFPRELSPKDVTGQAGFVPSQDWAAYQISRPNQYPNYSPTSSIAAAMAPLVAPTKNDMPTTISNPSSYNRISSNRISNGMSHNGVSNNGMSSNGILSNGVSHNGVLQNGTSNNRTSCYGMSGGPGGNAGTLTPGTSSSSHHTPVSSDGDFPSQGPISNRGGSCCSQPTLTQPQMTNQQQMEFAMSPFSPAEYMPGVPMDSNVPMSNGSIPGALSQQPAYGTNGFSQPDAHLETNSFGTHQQPLQHWQLQQYLANFPTFDTTHNCSCGPACNCLGCLAHPFNNATLQSVHETMMMMRNSYTNGKADISNGVADPLLPGSKLSPSPAQSPSDTESLNAGESIVSTDRFLFVEYPDPCMCGDNCSCVNCMIHREPRSETPNQWTGGG